MNNIAIKTLGFIAFVSTFVACSDTTSTNDASSCLRQLIDVGYSIKELSIRTDYPEEDLIKAYQSNNDVLTDSMKNVKLQTILDLNNEKKIIPINKTKISAYDCIWQLYTKAQNLPRTSLYTGIGVSKVAYALMKRKPLDENDSIRALVGYVNMKYELDEMPQSIDKYYTKTASLKDMVVPINFRPNVSDETKVKIDYYLYQNEQFELRANENLHKTLDSKVDSHVSSAINDFVNDDLGSIINTGICVFKDSLEEAEFFKEKLSHRLDLDNLNSDIVNEIITYCISVNCSRAILINEVLNYNEQTNIIDIPDRVVLDKYVNDLENAVYIMERQKQNLRVDAGAMIASLGLAFLTKGALNPAKTLLAVKTAQILLVEAIMYSGLDSTFKDFFGYKDNEEIIEKKTKELQDNIKSDLNQKMTKCMNGKDSYYETLNNNTREYYQQVRDYFQIK